MKTRILLDEAIFELEKKFKQLREETKARFDGLLKGKPIHEEETHQKPRGHFGRIIGDFPPSKENRK